MLIDKNNLETSTIDLTIPGDFRVRDKEAEEISKYQDPVLEILQM